METRRGLPNTYNYSHYIPLRILVHNPNISFQHRHCHTFSSTFHTFTPSNVLFHPFMLNLLFAYPIYLINTNVGPTTHPYYTKSRDHCRANKPDIKTIAEAARCGKELQTIFPLTSRCCHLILTAPMTSASSERSFSKLKLIKTVIYTFSDETRET